MSTDRIRMIKAVQACGDASLHLKWSDGTEAEIMLEPRVRKSLGDAAHFDAVTLGEWGHSVEWPNGIEMGADGLWLRTLSALGHDEARQFLEWRLRNGLSLSKAAEALGLARRTVAYYSNGDRPVPRSILLACKGWDASPELRWAA